MNQLLDGMCFRRLPQCSLQTWRQQRLGLHPLICLSSAGVNGAPHGSSTLQEVQSDDSAHQAAARHLP